MKHNTTSSRPAGRRSTSTARGFALRPLAFAALVLTQGVQALPTGGQVVNGQVQINQPTTNTMVLDQGTNKAIINWQGFGVGAQEKLTINQPNAQSVLLNRVVGMDPSYILGQMQANGRVFLLNPNGIVFGQNARVDVGSLVATTMHMNDTDFLAGRYMLTDLGGGQGDLAGRVINNGTINAPHGSVVLAGREVINSGQILAEGGRVGMIAASKVLVDVEGDGLLFFEVEGKEAGARLEQLGRIEANGGSVELMAASRGQMADTVLNMSGVVQARTLGMKGGRVVIDGGDTGITVVSGTLDVTGAEAGQKGGDAVVQGQRVLIDSTALIDASGSAGGGQVRVGGGFHGADASVRNADRVAVLQGARLKSNALDAGDGGKVVVWSDTATRFYGNIEARGAGATGAGGLVEVSGKKYLDFNGEVDLTARSGLFGTLLLDPTELTIQTTGNAKLKGTGSDSSPFEYDTTLPPASSDTQSTLGWDTIKSNLHTGNVKVQTSAGDIFIKDASGDLSENHDLTLLSAANIVQNTGAGMGNGGFGKITLQSGTGSSVFLNADVIFNSGVTINGPTVLNGNVEIWSGTIASKIDLQGPVTGNGHNLTLTYVGNAAGGEIKTSGAITGVGNFTANGKTAATTITLGGDVTTTGTQTYGSDVTLGTAVNLRGSAISLSGVSAGANNLGLRADSVSLAGGATGTGTVTFEPSSDTGVISVAGGAPVAAGTLQLNQSLLNKFSGWAGVVLGSTANAYKIAVGDFNLPTQIAARSSTGDISLGALNKGFGLSAQTTGRIDINGVVGGSNSLSNLNVNGQIHINTSSIKTSGNQSYAIDSGSVKLERTTALDAGGGKIVLAGVDGGGNNLTLTSASADADAIKTNGTIGSVAALSVNGKSTLGGDVSTSGTQSYSDTVTLSKTATSLSGSTVSFTKTVDATADGAQSLSVTGNANFGANVGTGKKLGSVAVSGSTKLNGDVTTTGTQSYGDVVTLSKTATSLSGSTVSFTKTVDATADGAQSLSVTGNASFGSDVGTAKKLGTLAVSGTTVLGGNVTTTGSQTYGSTTTLDKTGAAYTFTASALSFNGLAAGSNDLNFHVNNALTISGVLSGSGNVSIAGQAADAAISVGDPTAATDDIEISNSTLALFGPSFGSVTIGRPDGTGAVTFSNYTLTHNLGVRSGTGDITFGTLDGAYSLTAQTGGQIKLTGDVGSVTALSGLNFQGSVLLAPTAAAPIKVLTSGRQDYHGSMTLASDATLSGDTGVRFYDTVDGQPAAAKPNLVVKASSGVVQFDGSVGSGAIAPTLGAIDVTATSTVVHSDMSASVRQTYAGDVTLGNNVTFKAPALSFGNALFAGGNALGLLSDTPVAIAAGNLHGTGSIEIGPYDNATQIVFQGDPLLISGPGVLRISQADFARYVDAGFSSIKIGSTSGTGQIDVGAAGGVAIDLTHDLTLQSGTGAINLQARINGAHNLTLNTAGVTSINADVGGGTALTSLSTDAAGSTHLNANVRTVGNQTYRDAVEIGNTVATTTIDAAASTTFASTVDSASGTNNGLSVYGNAQFDSTIGGAQRLGSLLVTGAAQLAGNVSTTGYQQYSGNVELNQSIVLDSSGSYIYFPFGSTVNGAHAMTLKSATSYLYGAMGGTTPLTSLTVTGATYAMGKVTTSGGQSYGGPLTLIGSTALDSGAGKIVLGGVTGNAPGNDYSLTLVSTNAAADAISIGGVVSDVAAFKADGRITLGGDVTTTGTQAYTQNVTLGSGPVTLTTTGTTARLDVQGAVDGNGQNLTLNNTANTTDADAIRLSRDVSNVATLVANGRTTVGGDIATSGAQQYLNTLALAKDIVRLTSAAGAVTMQRLDGATNALEVTAPGGLNFQGDIVNLRGLSVFGSTTTTSFLNGGGLTTTNDQLYEGDVKIAGDATFSALQLRMLKSVFGLSATQQIHNLTLIANQMDISAALAGTGELKIAPSSAGVTMGINGASGSLQIDLSKVSGFTQRTIGADHAGDISANAMTLTGDTTIQTGGRVVLGGNVNGGHALTVEAKQGEVEFKHSIDGEYDLTDPAHPKVVTAPLTDLNVTAQTISFAGNLLHTTGAQRFNGDFRALNPFALTGASVSLHSSQALELTGLSLTSGGSIETQGVLTLNGNVWLGGGELILQSDLHPSNDGVAFKDSEWSAPNKGLTINNRVLREAEAGIEQTGGVITTEAGSRLNLRAPNRGSILIDHSENQLRGDVVAVSGPVGDTDASRFQGSGKLPVSYVRIDADQIRSAGIEADAVKLSTNVLTTAPGTKIRARLPFINAQGTETSLPALILAPKKPNELNLFGSVSPSTWIQVDVGDAGGGYVTVRTKGLGSGSSTIFLGGPDSATPFYDGTGKVSEIQIYYNGRTPSTPQEVGALNAVTAVIEESRRARFEEVVRTENVSARLRQGVIAEVGSGRPATEGSESIRMPQSCTPTNGLGC